MRVLWPVLLALGVIAAGCGSGPEHDPAHELETRLLAPCCWRQTLADHDSPLATALRAEIAEQVRAGVSPAAIEAGFVERYGPRILALGTSGTDPRWIIGAGAALAALAGAIALVVIGRRRPRASTVAPAAATADEGAYGDRLDDELAYVD